MYESLELYLTQMSFPDMDALQFTLSANQTRKRNYSASIVCSGWQGANTARIYAGKYSFTLIPEQVLMKKVAKNISYL